MDNRALYRIVLARHRPSDKEYALIRLHADDLMRDIQKCMEALKIRARAILGGSVAKGTVLKGSFDCDIFVAFDQSYRKENGRLPDLLESALRPLKGYNRVHGSRDYFSLERGGINYEIIPVLSVTDPNDALNVTDMSPLHVKWIEKELKKKPRLRDEIRLAKLFCKGAGVYGAESFINGFSGHVLDILVVYYGSFDGLMENAGGWQRYKVIDIMGHGSPGDLNRSKLSPLIVIDPVDRNRNAAAALSEDKFSLFRERARKFLDAPSEEFFIELVWTAKELKERHKGRDICILKAESLPGKTDISGAKLKKLFEHILRALESGGFAVSDSGWQWDRKRAALMWFVLKKASISSTCIREGPPTGSKRNAAEFKKKHPDAFIKGGRLFAEVKREHDDAASLIKSILDSDFAVQRATGLALLD